ncbi:MAG: hypothetical protein JEZ12_07130 [Desulfobacterium sp.]|nr:hypothetical protein [Desulfobacterium sp.]
MYNPTDEGIPQGEIISPTLADITLERSLILSEEKTVITHIDDGFDFLCFNVRKHNGKLPIKPES